MNDGRPENVTARTELGEFPPAKRTEISPLCFGAGGRLWNRNEMEPEWNGTGMEWNQNRKEGIGNETK